MDQDYHSAVFPVACLTGHVRRGDLRAFRTIWQDRINEGSHLAQLRHGERTIGLACLQVFKRHAEPY